MRFALAFLFCLIAIGCSRPPATPAIVAAAPAAPPPPAIQINPAPFLTNFASTTSLSNTVITWEAILAQFNVENTEKHGLASFFEKVGGKNSVIEKENTKSSLAQIARANTNVVLQLASGAYAGRCTFSESTNFIDHLLTSFGVDVLTQPRITSKGANEALLQVSNAQTIVLGATDKSVVTTNITVGPSVSVQLLGANDDGIVVEASARLEEFHGYIPEKKNPVRPVFVVSTMGTRTQLRTNEVLLLGGPIQMNVEKSVDRVAYLSDIPAIGRLFTKTQVQTNFVRTLVIIRPRVH